MSMARLDRGRSFQGEQEGEDMSSSTERPAQGAAPGSPIAEALDENKQATEEVKRAADDLAVVHAVLDTKLTKGVSDGDVKRAVAETNAVEKRLAESAEKLDRVNDTLEREVQRAR
jgi:hypothetical protein